MIECCPVCRAGTHDLVYRTTSPTFTTVRQGAPMRGDWFCSLALSRCRSCGHLYNRDFSSDIAAKIYGDTPVTNAAVHPTMASRLHFLVEWLGPGLLTGKRILEVGAGSGHLARILAPLAATVTVYEPCLYLTKAMLPEDNITLFTSTFPGPRQDCADVVICRQVIEHLEAPGQMLADIRNALAPGGYAYCEVPDADFITRTAAFTDIHINHVQYFSRPHFCRLAARFGLTALRVLTIKEGHDFGVLLTADDGRAGQAIGECVHPAAADLGARLAQRIDLARQGVAALPGPLALYGATAHTQIFLNALGGTARFAAVLDDNPANRGWMHYDQAHTVSVISAEKADLSRFGSVIIGAYLHDTVIASRLRESGFGGAIASVRPTAPPDSALFSSIFGGAPQPGNEC